jgi:hypothetical protein
MVVPLRQRLQLSRQTQFQMHLLLLAAEATAQEVLALQLELLDLQIFRLLRHINYY